MALEPKLQSTVDSYARKDLHDEEWHKRYFDFVGDQKLADRLREEFYATRYVYKLLEGMTVTGTLQRAEIRTQILAYASIYEAVLHHVLFVLCPSSPEVEALSFIDKRNDISIPPASLSNLSELLVHNGHPIIPTYVVRKPRDITKLRFDQKAICACSLGFITAVLRDELIGLYEARNAIHIHAEIKKNTNYHLDLSRRAYRRMILFKRQVSSELASRGLLLGAT
jgi:hypothetical protein